MDVWGGNKAHSHREFAANVVLLKLIHSRFTELGEKCISVMYFGITDSCMLPTKTLKVFLWVYMYTRNKKVLLQIFTTKNFTTHMYIKDCFYFLACISYVFMRVLH